MKIIFRILIFVTLAMSYGRSMAQMAKSKFLVDPSIQDTFSFIKKWKYPWGTLKDDSTNQFYLVEDGPLTKSDTAHLYYTANCFTNVQGGYYINYCSAEKRNQLLSLTFNGGLPAYASEFYVFIRGDSFSFKPKVIYPVITLNQRIAYKITKQYLKINKSKYLVGNIIMGHVRVEFTEIISQPGKNDQVRDFYIEGDFRTILEGRL